MLDIDGEVRRRCSKAGDEVGVLVRYNGSRQRKVIDADGKAVDLRKHVEGLKKVATSRLRLMRKVASERVKRTRPLCRCRIAEVRMKVPGKRCARWRGWLICRLQPTKSCLILVVAG